MITVKRFTASWCQPCKQLIPIIEQIQREMSSVNFETVDVDANPDIAIKYNVRSVPTLVFEKNGQEINRTLGVQTKSVIAEIIKKFS
jgi:thioredoxin 1